jgi:MFS family permease
MQREETEREDTERDETESERLDRNFGDLLQELRVAQTGVQILFAFLLTMPFSARFGDIDDFERIVYIVALLAAAAAAALIIGPVAYHRMLFRQGRKPQLVFSAHRMASGGLAFLWLAMVCAVLLVCDVVIGRPAAIIVALITAGWIGLLWGILPWLRRNDGEGPVDDDRPS